MGRGDTCSGEYLSGRPFLFHMLANRREGAYVIREDTRSQSTPTINGEGESVAAICVKIRVGVGVGR